MKENPQKLFVVIRGRGTDEQNKFSPIAVRLFLRL